MISDWLSRVGSSIPRGFSRRYVLDLLTEQPMTGKEIIDKAIVQSQGKWRPSPGLIYPMLGRLLDEGLVDDWMMEDIQLQQRDWIWSNVESIHNSFKNK